MVSDNLPLIEAAASAAEVISAISGGGLGMAIVATDDKPAVITDGDLRRAIELHQESLFSKTAADLMTPNPVTVMSGTRVEDALVLMDQKKITSVLVTDQGQVVGVFKK
jgi:arabinose-5-phosphate isomerase